MMKYQLFFNSNGQFESANDDQGRSIPYYPLNPSHSNLSDELTIAFLAAVEAGELDISDRLPVAQIDPPDWDNFRREITLAPAYLRIVGFDSQTIIINQTLVVVLRNPDGELINYWNAIAAIANPTTQEIEQLNTIAAKNNIPFKLNANGMMEPA